MVFNTTFKNISVAVSLIGGGNQRPVASHRPALSHTVVSNTHRNERGLIDTDCTGGCKSNYHAITTTTSTPP